MKNKRMTFGISMIIILVTVEILYVSYDGVLPSQMLYSSIKSSVYLNSLSEPQIFGHAMEVEAPKIELNQETTISDYRVLLSKYGDSIKYYFNVCNFEVHDITLEDYQLGVPECSGIDECNIDYSITYIDGSELNPYVDIIKSGEVKGFVLSVSFSDDEMLENELSEAVIVNNLGVKLFYD